MKRLRPGDLLSFTDWSPTSIAIEVSTLSWPGTGAAHIGVIAELPFGKGLGLYESLIVGPRSCLIQGRIVHGVQAQDPTRRIEEYRGTVRLHRLRDRLTPDQEADLLRFLYRMIGTRYDSLGAIAARELCLGWLLHRVLPESLNRVYCSELCAAALREAGRFPAHNASVYSPNALIRFLEREKIVYPAQIVKRGRCPLRA